MARRSHLKGRAPFRERDQRELEDNLIFCFFLSFKFCPPHFLFIGYQSELEDNLIFRFFFSFEFCPPYFFGGLLQTRESWRTTYFSVFSPLNFVLHISLKFMKNHKELADDCIFRFFHHLNSDFLIRLVR